MKIKSSRKLYAFYKDWLKWAKSGAPRHKDFDRGIGLCGCYQWYTGFRRGYTEELKRQFQAAGLNPIFPFGHSQFDEDYENDTMHTRRARLKWVEQRLADGQDSRWEIFRKKLEGLWKK